MKLRVLFGIVLLCTTFSCVSKRENVDIVKFGNSLVMYPDKIDSIFNNSKNININTYSNNLLNKQQNVRAYSDFLKKYNKKCTISNSITNIRNNYIYSKINISSVDLSLSIDMYFKRQKQDSIWKLINLGFTAYDVK